MVMLRKYLQSLHKEREELYEKVSDHVVMTENKSSQDVASEIISLVKS
jgi:shikimate kinase